MNARLHTLTACLVAAIYGLVGVTGESLHYLVTTPDPGGHAAKSGKAAGYFHFHDPDHHLHFHGHHGHFHVHDACDDADPETKSSAEDRRGVSQSPPVLSHQPHACPLLSVVSTLKLGHASCLPTTLEFDGRESLRRGHDACLAFDRSLHSLARGPPHSLSS
jgi:hypothetical protein